MIHEAREAMKAKNDERYHKRRVDAAKIGVAQSTANKTITRGLQQAFGNYGFEGGVIGTTLAAGAFFGRGARVRAAARMAAEEAAIAKAGVAASKAAEEAAIAKAASHVPDHIPTQSVIKTNHVSEAQHTGVAEKSIQMTIARQLDGLENPAIPEVLSAKRFADVRRDAEKILSKKSIQLPGRGKVQGLAKVSEKYTENTAPELLPEATDAISESFLGIDNDLYRTDMVFQASDAFTRHRFGKDISSPEAIMFRYEFGIPCS
ncbi:hypothetical protein FACS1894189_8800 [Planctomycetales bacterium]|nr:hypothetical protein FACS1894189_8800 [Planctomycetales bacterium]